MTNLTPTPTPITVPSGAAPPPALSPGARTALRALMVITAVVLMLGGIGGLTAAAVGIGNTRMVVDTQPLPATMRALTVDTGALPMAVRITSDPDVTEPSVELRFVSARQAGEHTLDISAGTDTRIEVRGETPDWLEWARAGELTVVLPTQLSQRMTINTDQQFGVLKVDADLDRLVARSRGGAVILNGATRSVDAEVQDGAVVAYDPILVQDSFSANVIDGDITVDFRGVAPRTIDATTVDGDVVLGLPEPGPYLIDAATGSRRDDAVIDVPQTRDRSEATSVITARSSGGDVVIEQLR